MCHGMAGGFLRSAGPHGEHRRRRFCKSRQRWRGSSGLAMASAELEKSYRTHLGHLWWLFGVIALVLIENQQ